MIELDIQNLCVRIRGEEILKDIDFALNENVSVGIVGESGSGKTMLVRSITGLLPDGAEASGSYEIDGTPFDLNASERKWRSVRGSEIGMIMQDPFTALEPLTKCGKQIRAGASARHSAALGVTPGRSVVSDVAAVRNVASDEQAGHSAAFDVTAALEEVGLRADIANRYPFELSGGMRQRVVIAAALATEPKLLIADEATTALDVITQREILDLIDEIRARRKMPLIIITHDVKLVYQRTDRVIVMDKGRIVEWGPTRSVIENPREDYTKTLVEADRFLNVSSYPAYSVGGDIILRVDGLVKKFDGRAALSGVSIEVGAGECVGVVGESGSGKTTLARCIVGLTKPDAGVVKYFGKGNPQIVFQDPYSSLNPAHTVRYILEEALRASGRAKDELADLLNVAEIPEELLGRRPASLSGGQRQRVAIARALAPRPELLICDESVSALDIVIQNQILRTIERLRKERGLAVLFITHDLSVVRMLSGRIYVMHDAAVVNEGSTERIFEGADDPYTQQLIDAADVGALGLDDVNMWKREDFTPSPAALYTNGVLYTVSGGDWDKSPREAMAVGGDGRILSVGTEEEARAALEGTGLSYGVTDLKGRAVFPGFIDTHVHMPGSALTELFGIYLYECRTLEETLGKIRAFVEARPDQKIYFGTGFYMSVTDDPVGLRKEWLDEIERDKPILLNSSDGHSYWLNSAAIAALGITAETEATDGGLIGKDSETGELTGIVTDVPSLITIEPQYNAQECERALRRYQEKQTGWGYTAAMHIAPHFCSVQGLKNLDDLGAWRMRVNLSALADVDRPIREALADAATMREEFSQSKLVKTTAVKFFEDGVVEGKTAYLKAPYAEGAGVPEGYRSEPLWETGKLTEAFAEVSRAGYQIHVHAIGDAAVQETLRALKTARASAGAGEGAGEGNRDVLTQCASSEPEDGNRDVLTHLQLVDEEEIRLMKELGVIASFQPFWHFKEPFWYDEIDQAILGRARAEAAYPVGSAVKSGVRVTFSGDYPASPVNDPFWAIQIAVTRNLADADHYGVDAILSQDDDKWLRNAKERISLKEAIEAYTINGAYQLFREAEIGSIEKGKMADFIVLTDDPFRAIPTDLYKIKVKGTFISGRRV
ncbi:MAG: amidohydrolase family protein [Clostridiales Family XIII bacterium]|jgi:ABC-type glutathione transport system ATPase component/predicted amidohydrolase YtcJ|nr:amidohydrolase family protein [Clostridiales Family XIII bacterium]